jgi:hypothetical protein
MNKAITRTPASDAKNSIGVSFGFSSATLSALRAFFATMVFARLVGLERRRLVSFVNDTTVNHKPAPARYDMAAREKPASKPSLDGCHQPRRKTGAIIYLSRSAAGLDKRMRKRAEIEPSRHPDRLIACDFNPPILPSRKLGDFIPESNQNL